MANISIDEARGIVEISPDGPLSEEDFARITVEVDGYLASHDKLQGLLIVTEHFPGWESFGALVGHLRFVHDHHQKIRRVAFVTDSAIAAMPPTVAEHFVSAELKRFEFSELEAARTWVAGTE